MFLETEYPRLVGAVAMVARSRAVAEDCVQEALARAWERTERGEHLGSLVAWVTTVAMNLSKSWLRRMRVEREAQPKLVAGAGAQSLDGTAVDVRRALAALPRRQREATVLRYFLGMTVAEIARALGVAEGTAKTTLFRARRALAAALGEQEEADIGR